MRNGGDSDTGADAKPHGHANGDSERKPQMAKNPLAESDSDLEEILPEEPSARKTKPEKASKKRPPPPSRGKKPAGGKATKRRRKAGDSNSEDEDFEPSSDDEDEEDASEESVRSEDLSEENISDSDFVPSDEAEEADAASGNANEETIQLSSDGESSPPEKSKATEAAKSGRENIQTFDPNSTVRKFLQGPGIFQTITGLT